MQSVYELNTTLVLVVCYKTTVATIGNISLQSIGWIDRSVGIAFLLGEKDFLGKSVMYDAGKFLIKHVFEILNLKSIHCVTSSENIGMQKVI